MLRIFLFLALISLPLPAIAQAQVAAEAPPTEETRRPTFYAESITLENGIEIVVVPNHRAPVVTHMVWYKVGAADEPTGSSGMAHYFEHLMFKGSEHVPPGAFSKTVKALGGNDNAFTSQDYTAYFQSIAKEHLSKVMEMEADRMTTLNPPPEEFITEKNVVLEERKQRSENDPRAMFGEQLRSALFINHPYGTPVIGWMDEIKNYGWGDVKTFYDIWYAPNNAVVVISGDVTMKEVKPLAEQIYGVIPPKDVLPRVRPAIPPASGESRVVYRDPSIRQPMFQQIYLAPSFNQDKDASFALQVLAEILDGGPTTRLYKSLVVEQGKATSVSFSYDSDAVDYAAIYLAATPVNGVALPELEALLMAEIKKVIAHGVTQAEVDDAVQRLQDAAIFARDSVTGPAMIFGRALATGGTVEDVENWVYNIAEVTPEDVKMAAQLFLDPAKPWIRPPVTGYLEPSTAQGEQQ